jgi:predicted ester cyclase
MRRSRIRVALVGLCLALGVDGAGGASGSAPSEAGAGSTTCPSTSDEQKLAVARAWHEDVINRRNPATLQDILAPEVVHHAAGGYPAVMNRDGVTAMMNDFLRAFPDLQYAFDLLLVRDDYVVQRYTATGTHQAPLGQLAPSGRRATWTGINIFRIHCGRIAEVWSEVDALRRNQQLTGASPPR